MSRPRRKTIPVAAASEALEDLIGEMMRDGSHEQKAERAFLKQKLGEDPDALAAYALGMIAGFRYVALVTRAAPADRPPLSIVTGDDPPRKS